VALVGRRLDRLEGVARELTAMGAEALVVQADLAHSEQLARVVGQAREAFGPVDLLVNNAAMQFGGGLGALTADEVARAVATNLLAPIELTRLALPDLRARRGAVVLVASAMSLVPMPYATLYSATKAGVRAFGEALRYELEPQGVRLLLAYPPTTDTDMTRGADIAAGLPRFPKRKPEYVGERIVLALLAGRREITFRGIDRLLWQLYRFLPGLASDVLASQRHRFARMMAGRRSDR
jgi:short-subunit dehydrogenase